MRAAILSVALLSVLACAPAAAPPAAAPAPAQPSAVAAQVAFAAQVNAAAAEAQRRADADRAAEQDRARAVALESQRASDKLLHDDAVRRATSQCDSYDTPLGSLEGEEDPAAPAAKRLTEWRDCIVRLRAVDEDAGRASARRAVEWATQAQADVAQEKECRVTPACIAARLTPPLCEAIAWTQELSRQIAAERSNPSGVVDLARLHAAGEGLQQKRAEITERKQEFAAKVKKPFDVRACASLPPTP